jgi:zinc and cadmium transporter
MQQYIVPILASFVISLISFIGVFAIPLEKFKKAIPLLVALAAGTMIGDVFLHIIPNAIEERRENFDPSSFIWIIVGICLFYLLETSIHWHHHHSTTDMEKPHHIAKIATVGDLMHNFFDGLGVAVAFSISPAVGYATTLAYILHEIPQEIGDYAIFISSGWSRKKALFINFITGLIAVLGTVIGLVLIKSWEPIELPILMLTAGSLIYIALADLIPESNNQNLKHHKNFRFVVFCSFSVGVLIMYSLVIVEKYLGV